MRMHLVSALLLLALPFLVYAGRKEVKLVIWDDIVGRLNWLRPEIVRLAHDKCNTKCVVTKGRENLKEADAIIFHAMTNEKSKPPRPAVKPPHAKYVLMSMEQPKYATMLQKKDLASQFDALATYRQSESYLGVTNIPLTYYPLNLVSQNEVRRTPVPFNQKKGLQNGAAVATFTSNCHNAGASSRYEYIEKLMKKIKVHSFGRCFHNIEEPTESPARPPHFPQIAMKRLRKMNVLRRYKFYLAFENSMVEDYVSEKMFEGLIAGSVPIYRGSQDIGQFLPSNMSVINAQDMSPEELTSLLLRIQDDPDEYDKYMQWKKDPLPQHFVDMTLRSYTHFNVLCRLCSYASTGRIPWGDETTGLDETPSIF